VLEKILVIFTIPELRQKILLTLGLLAIYRVGWQVPLPIVDADVMSAFSKEAGGVGELLRTVAVFSASQLSQATIFGLGIMTYISASIIFQLAGGIRSALGYCGCRSIEEMRTRPKFVRITGAGMRESHVHDVTITKEAPNYRGS